MNELDKILAKASNNKKSYASAENKEELKQKDKKPKGKIGRPKREKKAIRRAIYHDWTALDEVAKEMDLEPHILIKELLNISLRDLGKLDSKQSMIEKMIRIEIANAND